MKYVIFGFMILLYIGSYFLAMRILFRYRYAREVVAQVCSCRTQASVDSVNDVGRKGCEYMLEYFDTRGVRHVAAFERPFGFPKLSLFDKLDIYYNPNVPGQISVPDAASYYWFFRLVTVFASVAYGGIGVFVFSFLWWVF